MIFPVDTDRSRALLKMRKLLHTCTKLFGLPILLTPPDRRDRCETLFLSRRIPVSCVGKLADR
jgi:hypothetical protein